MKNKNPFDTTQSLLTEAWFEIENNKFMVNKILSTSPLTFEIAVRANKYLSLPNWAVTGLLNNAIKKNRLVPKFFWVKKESVNEPKLCSKLSSHFSTNKKHTEQIIKLLRKMGIEPEQYFGLKEGD
jgi:hypothetical protein